MEDLLYYVQILCPEINRHYINELKNSRIEDSVVVSARQNYVHMISVKEKYSEHSHPIKQITYYSLGCQEIEVNSPKTCRIERHVI